MIKIADDLAAPRWWCPECGCYWDTDQIRGHARQGTGGPYCPQCGLVLVRECLTVTNLGPEDDE